MHGHDDGASYDRGMLQLGMHFDYHRLARRLTRLLSRASISMYAYVCRRQAMNLPYYPNLDPNDGRRYLSRQSINSAGMTLISSP